MIYIHKSQLVLCPTYLIFLTVILAVFPALRKVMVTNNTQCVTDGWGAVI